MLNVTKVCKTCSLPKDSVNDFYSYVKNSKTYYESSCKDCRNIRNNKNYLDNRDKRLSYAKQYHLDNLAEQHARNNKYHNEHKEERKQYYDNNREEILNNKKKYYEANKEKIKEYNRKLAKNNRNKINTLQNKRRLENPEIKLRHNISTIIRQVLKKNKRFSILKYLDYTIQELKEHLENQFESWMTWDNHGIYNSKTWDDGNSSTWTWNIDHIIPQSDLLYTSMQDENFKKCWSLKNLRPYSAKQNLIDGASKSRHLTSKRKRYVK